MRDREEWKVIPIFVGGTRQRIRERAREDTGSNCKGCRARKGAIKS